MNQNQNILIARLHGRDVFERDDIWWEKTRNNGNTYTSMFNIKYHSNWSDLFEVIEAIEKRGYSLTIGRNASKIRNKNGKLLYQVRFKNGYKFLTKKQATFEALLWLCDHLKIK